MTRVIRWFGVPSLLLLSVGSAWGREIPEVSQTPEIHPVAGWPAPLFWTPPAARTPGQARTEAVNTASGPLPFVAVSPCRVADTRGNGFTGAYGPPALVANATRNFTITGQCGIPLSAVAVSFNFGALNVGAAGDLRVFPAGGAAPLVSTLNYNANTPNIANAAIVPLGTGGAISVLADATAIDLIIDLNGYYAPDVNANIGTIFNYTGNGTVNSTLAISGATNAASPNEIRAAGPIPVPCTVDTFSVFMDTAPTVLTIFTLQRNANDGNGFLNTNATCQIGVGGQVCQATAPSVAFAAGDLVMTSVTGAAGAGGRASVSFRCR